jgi:hypothetical protein
VGLKTAVTVAALVLCASILGLAPEASAELVRPGLGPFGSTSQPSFAEAKGLSVQQGTHNLLVIDGKSEVQKVSVAATSGSFKLKIGAVSTAEVSFNATNGQLEEAINSALSVPCAGGVCVFVSGGPGSADGSNPYVLSFTGPLASTNVAQAECENGSPPLGGVGTCVGTTTVEGVDGSIKKFNADGTPSNFTAISANAIDGKGGEDATPQNGLAFFPNAGFSQVSVDESGGLTNGNIYVNQLGSRLADVFAPSGKFLGQITQYKEGETATGPFQPLNEPCGVTTDSSGNVYVGDFSSEDLVHKYDPAANPVTNSDNVANFGSLSGISSPCAVAAGAGPTAGSLFVDRANGELFKIDAGTGALKYKISDGVTTVTVDPANGHVFAAAGNQIREYDAASSTAATLVNSFIAESAVSGIAVDGTLGAPNTTGTVYISRAGSPNLEVFGPLVRVPDVVTGEATEVAGTTATLNGTIGADTVSGAECHFEYVTEAQFKSIGFTGAATAACEPPGPFSGTEINSVSGKAIGLESETKYVFRIVGENENGESQGKSQTFETQGIPLISGGAASEVGATKATISGLINPRGEETSFAVELTTKAQFDESGFEGATVLSGGTIPGTTSGSGKLAAGSEEVSSLQTAAGRFTAGQSISGPGIPSGTTIVSAKPGSLVLSAAATEAVESATLTAIGFQTVSLQLNGLSPATTYRFRLIAENEAGVAEPGDAAGFTTLGTLEVPLLDGRVYEMVSPANKQGEVFPPEPGPRAGLGGTCTGCIPGFIQQKAPMQSSPDGNSVAYEGGAFSEGLAPGANEYVARRAAGGWATTPMSGSEYAENSGQGFKGFSEDLSRSVVYQIEPPISPEAPPNYANLYLREGSGAPQPLITQAPPQRTTGEVAESLRLNFAGANAGTGSAEPYTHVIFQANDALTEEVPGIAPEAPEITADETNLYEWSEGELHLVNVLPNNAEAAANAVFGSGILLTIGGENFNFDHAISDDGSRIFWSSQPSGQVYMREGGTTTVEFADHMGKFLTATPDGSEVLLSDGVIYDVDTEAQTDLTGGLGGFLGMAGASEDLSRVYFVDTEILSGEENANEETAQAGKPNLYLWEEGEVSFIGTLRAQDNSIGSVGVWRAAPGNRMAQATADGRFLAFESRASLTGYDNRVSGGGVCRGSEGSVPGCYEVFEFDAQTGGLSCSSCNPAGVQPLGPSNLSQIFGVREFFPQPDNLPPEGEGRLFFESQDTLTQRDTNGHIQDVYEWEPNGVGDCTRPEGCLALISSGQSPKDSQFINASASGNDVFFTTSQQLVSQDQNNSMDLYDARVGGGIAEEGAAPCEGEACKRPLSPPPTIETPGSSGIAGNEPAPPKPKPKCKSGYVRKGNKCVKKHKPKKHHKAKHRRAATHKKGGAR